MSEFKVGDKVLYKTINMRGIITEKSSETCGQYFFKIKVAAIVLKVSLS